MTTLCFDSRQLFNVLLMSLLCAVSSISCKEEFPPYTEPTDILQGSITVTSPDTVEVHYDGTSRMWFVNTPLTLKVTLTNLHDDLLQGAARINGRITLQSFAQVPRTFVVQLANGNLRAPPIFQGNIALAPGAKAELSELWLPYGVDRSFVLDGLPYITVGTDRIYSPITFIAFVEVQIFERIQSTKSDPFEFTRVFRQRQ